MSARLRSLFVLSIAALSVPVQTQAGYKVDIEYAEWGFDGRAVPGHFNLLTVEVRNSGDQPFEGKLTLRRLVTTAGAWTGVEHVEQIFVGPYSQKLLHFYPYILESADEWEIRWGPTVDDTFVVERPALSNGGRVILNDETLVSGIIPALKGFRDDLFPPTVTGTDSLRCVVLDHTPRWEEARRRAFRDWLFRGGVLHVLHESAGDYPVLPVEELNGNVRPERFGGGRIYWHDIQRSALSREFIYDEIYSTSRGSTTVYASSNVSLDVDPTSRKYYTRFNNEEFFHSFADWHPEELIPARLRELVTPAHNWLLIYILSAVYLLLIFPGGAFLNRTRLDYRFSMGGLILIVGLWSWMFLAIGSRGYGESTSVCSTATLRQLPDGRWDVEQWSSLFVTTGTNSTLTHPGESLAYSTAQAYEQIEGAIENGDRGGFTVDMPPFTFRTYAHRNQIQAEPVEVTIESFESGPRPEAMFDSDFEPLKTVTAQVKGRLPTTPTFGYVLYGNHIYELDLTAFLAGRGNLISGSPLEYHNVVPIMDRRFRRFEGNVREDRKKGLNRFAVWMLARSMHLRRGVDVTDFELPEGLVRICLFGDLPQELHAVNAADRDARLGNQFGRVLYCINVPLPDTY